MNTLRDLLDKLASEDLDQSERKELQDLLMMLNPNEAKALLEDTLSQTHNTRGMDDLQAESMLAAITGGASESPVFELPRRRRTKTMWWVAAAAVALSAVSLVWLRPEKPAIPVVQGRALASDVKAPSGNRATITLANGNKLFLDELKNGSLAKQGQVELKKTGDGQVIYSGQADGVVAYNTIANPRGSKVVDLTLQDGTHVWLNSGSSMTYPVSFANNERRVSMTGEAFFDVKHFKDKPFRVQVGNETVEDIGTQFNVNAFDDEAPLVTTVASGSIRLRDRILREGNQGVINASGGLALNNSVNVDDVLAWKNGEFSFHSVGIESIMKQVGRWYDVEIVFPARIGGTFSGGISRDVNASEMLQTLAYTGALKFEIQGKKIIVTAKK